MSKLSNQRIFFRANSKQLCSMLRQVCFTMPSRVSFLTQGWANHGPPATAGPSTQRTVYAVYITYWFETSDISRSSANSRLTGWKSNEHSFVIFRHFFNKTRWLNYTLLFNSCDKFRAKKLLGLLKFQQKSQGLLFRNLPCRLQTATLLNTY